jgi:hypothetical protein
MCPAVTRMKPAKIPAGVALLVVFGLSIAILAADSDSKLPEATNEKPIWSVDLRTFGFARDQEPRITFFGMPKHYSFSTLDTHALAFSSKNQIVVAFTTQEVNGRKTVPGTLQLHLASFNAATGDVVATKDSPTPYSSFPLVATERGNFLLRESYRLILYSPKLERINELNMELLKPPGEFASFSTDGRYIFVEGYDRSANELHTPRMFNADTLEELKPETAEAASDHKLTIWQERRELHRRSLYLRSDSTWKEIYRDSGCNESSSVAYLLRPSLLAIVSCHKLTLMNTEGNVYFSTTFPRKHELESFGASSNGQRFALAISELKKQPFWLGDPGYDRIHPTLIVYDADNHEAVSTFTLNQKGEMPFGFSLSADGSQIALLRGGVLELYQITGKH